MARDLISEKDHPSASSRMLDHSSTLLSYSEYLLERTPGKKHVQRMVRIGTYGL